MHLTAKKLQEVFKGASIASNLLCIEAYSLSSCMLIDEGDVKS